MSPPEKPSLVATLVLLRTMPKAKREWRWCPCRASRLGRAGLAAVVGTAMLLVMALWIGNPLLAPMKLDQEKIAEAGRMLSDGIPYRVPDLEIDYAALRSAQISELPETPDVVILGGTPWRHLHQDLGWGASVFNAFHPGVSVTDIRRTVQSLSAAGRLPGRILLSIEPDAFGRTKCT